MKAIRVIQPNEICVVDVEKPAPKPNEALIRVVSAGICGSDIGAFRGTNGLVSYPRIIGHELAGVVESIPKNNKKQIKAGDKVVIDPYLYCGQCYPCLLGRTNCCTSLNVLGVHVDGGMAEYIAHPADMLIPVHSDTPWELLALVEPLTIAIHGLHRLCLSKGEHVAIFGAGPIGLLAAMAALYYGAVPVVIDPIPQRLEMAQKLGVSKVLSADVNDLPEAVLEITKGRGCECVMEASGAALAVRSALNVASFAGRVVLTGWPKAEISIPTDIITRKELDVRGARTSAGEFEEALHLVESGNVSVRDILTKTVPLNDAAKAVQDISKNPEAYLKVVAMLS